MSSVRPKITFDTNCIINLFDSNSTTATSVAELNTLMRYALDGKAEISVTTRLSADLAQDRNDERRAELMRTLELFPVLATIVRLDLTALDSCDVLSSPDDVRLHNEIQAIVFPNLDPTRASYGNKINDIDHLVGHVLNKRDIFVTDDKDILRKRDQLRRAPGVAVMKPAECVNYLDEIALQSPPVTFPSEGINPAYHSPGLTGTVIFDYSNNDHRYTIGEGIYLFETRWSKASDVSIHAYNDGPSIGAIALARNCDEIANISDAAMFDFSSRVRSPSIGKIVIWRNVNGLYAATKVLAIKDDSRRDEQDELTFEYVILSGGGASFAGQ